jgi:hypothetical protein
MTEKLCGMDRESMCSENLWQLFLSHSPPGLPLLMSEFDQGDLSAVEGAWQPKNILITGGAGFM